MITNNNTSVKLSSLPNNIQSQIPLSIRKFKDEYILSDLPPQIIDLISSYLLDEKSVEYPYLLDCKPKISAFGDFQVIDSVYNLVLEYFKNYLLILPGNFPFDCQFGCSLKFFLQKRDTTLQMQLITAEVNNISQILSSDLNINIMVVDVNIDRLSMTGAEVEYNCTIVLKIDNVEKIMKMSISN